MAGILNIKLLLMDFNCFIVLLLFYVGNRPEHFYGGAVNKNKIIIIIIITLPAHI